MQRHCGRISGPQAKSEGEKTHLSKLITWFVELRWSGNLCSTAMCCMWHTAHCVSIHFLPLVLKVFESAAVMDEERLIHLVEIRSYFYDTNSFHYKYIKWQLAGGTPPESWEFPVRVRVVSKLACLTNWRWWFPVQQLDQCYRYLLFNSCEYE